VLAVDQGDGPIPALTTGEPSPLGGTFESGPGVEQVHVVGRTALFAASTADVTGSASTYGLFARHLGDGTIDTLLRGDQPGTGLGPFPWLELLGVSGRRPLITAQLGDGRTALFEVRRGRARPIAVQGEPVPGGTLATIEQALVAHGRLFFEGQLVDHAGRPVRGLFAWTPGDAVALLARLPLTLDSQGSPTSVDIFPGPRRTPLVMVFDPA